MDLGLQYAAGQPINTPLPTGWLGRADAPPGPPTWANIKVLGTTQIKSLLAQIAYDQSQWDYTKIGSDNQVGRYQFQPLLLEVYGLLTKGSVATHGTDAVNFKHCWKPTYIATGINDYQNYFYNTDSLTSFLNTKIAQEHLAYQRLVDIYMSMTNIDTILSTDSTDVVAGMMYVGWTLGIGEPPTIDKPNGTGTWAWRYKNIGNGALSYNSGRYSITSMG